MIPRLTKQFLQSIIILLFFSISIIQAQINTLWTKTFGGYDYDLGNSVQLTSDGGYIIVGGTYSFGAGGSDFWLLKTNSSGDTLWTKMFGGINLENGKSVQQTTDGGYIIVGWTFSFGVGGQAVWLIKTNSSGDTLWTKTFGGSMSEGGNSVQQTTDGGYVIVGWTSSFGAGGGDVWLIKTNSSGDTLWTKTFGGSSSDVGNSVQQTTDGGYIIAGYTYSYGVGGNDVWLIKTNSSGDTLWTKTFGGSDRDVSNSIQQTEEGGYVITGWTDSFGAGDKDVLLIKTNASGDALWTKTFGGSDWDEGRSVHQTFDGEYIIAGYTYSYGVGNGDVFLIKTKSSGDTLWTKTFGGNDWERCNSVQQTIDGGYILVGETQTFGAGGGDVWLIKTSPEVNVNVQNDDLKSLDYSMAQNYPNPFNSITSVSYKIKKSGHIRILVFNVEGQVIEVLLDKHQTPGEYQIRWDAGEMASGIYFYHLIFNDYQTLTRKMILIK